MSQSFYINNSFIEILDFFAIYINDAINVVRLKRWLMKVRDSRDLIETSREHKERFSREALYAAFAPASALETHMYICIKKVNGRSRSVIAAIAARYVHTSRTRRLIRAAERLIQTNEQCND